MVRISLDIIVALVEGDVSVLKNLAQLKAQLLASGTEPSDEVILAAILPTLPEAYQCIRVFAAQMSERLLARQTEELAVKSAKI